MVVLQYDCLCRICDACARFQTKNPGSNSELCANPHNRHHWHASAEQDTNPLVQCDNPKRYSLPTPHVP